MPTHQTTLVVIDAQKEYEADGALPVANLGNSLSNIKKLLDFFRKNNLPIIHVRHISADPDDSDFAQDTRGIEFIDEISPAGSEKIVTKHYPSAFSGEGFSDLLEKAGATDLVICGYSSFLCCDSTAREAFHKDFTVWFVEDAISCFDLDNFSAEELHRYTCAVLEVMFANIVKTDEIISQLSK